MKRIWKRILTFILCVSLLMGGLPVSVQAATKSESKGYVELNDGYLSVKVSEKNGGFLVDTVEGDKLSKADNNKFLLYPDEAYDTSFTSFRVTRNGKTKDYVFGRNYSFLGLGKNDLTVTKTSENTITTVWKVDGMEFTQIMSLMDMEAQQHGMVYITYSVKNTTDKDIENIQARIMMDTALGYQDYAVYMAGQSDSSYTTIKTERTLKGDEYSNYFFAYDDEYTPGITAYTLNASVGGKTIVPEKVTFAHWNNLAASVFDYEPHEDYTQSLNFTNPYNEKYMTADSATAMYYDMGSAAAGKESTQPIGMYYGVYSNATATEGSVALNFAGPVDMILNQEKTGYVDLNGDAQGNFTMTTKVQNVSDKVLEYVAVVIRTPESMASFDLDGKQNTTTTDGEPFYVLIRNLQPGETRDVTLNYLAEPTDVSDYRKIQVEVFDISDQLESANITLLEEKKLVERENYILCPSVEGGTLSFLGVSPEVIYVSGTRNLQFTGKNFGLLRDTTRYQVILRPTNGTADVIVPASNVIINAEDNTATLVLDQYLRPGTWNVVIDWYDTGKMDLTSDALRFVVSDKEMYRGGTFGVITMTVSGDGTDGSPYHYTMNIYRSEEDYVKKTGGKASKNVLLVLRGDFTLQYDDSNRLLGAEAIALKGGEAISINECLDVTDGRLTISVEYDENGNQTAINTDIDGEVYTTGAHTKVWSGVCAITSLEEGELVKFPVYKYDGSLSGYVEDQTANTNMLMLLWPGAASTAQTIAGMVMELRYAQFGIMATEPGAEADKHVVSFGAQLSPNFLIPNNFDYGTIQTPAIDIAQINLAKSNYLPHQLREVQNTYQKDLENWGKAGGGGLDLRITDVLYGGGFIGFNTSIEVGLPSYTDGFPAIEGTLNLKVINDEWALGVEGSANIIVMEMEAELALRSHNSIPVLDKVRFRVGGMMPGVPVDPMGVFWVCGAGAGIDKIYETFFVSSSIPPLTLLMHGEFAIFNILSTEADISLSGRGISASLSNLGIKDLTVLDYVGGKVYWYPRLDIGLGVKASILDIIKGEGSIILQQIPDGVGGNDLFWQAFLTAGIEIPLKYPIIGGINLATADLGMDQERIFGVVHILKLDAGVTYYWGGDVEFAVGKYDVPEPTMPTTMAIAKDAATGRTLYLSTSNIRLLGGSQVTEVADTQITSSKDMRKHSFILDGRANEDALISLSFPAESEMAAQLYQSQLKFVYGDGSNATDYNLVWFDRGKNADAPENLEANAIYNYDKESKTVNVTISVTEDKMYDVPITIETANASQIMLYGVGRLADMDSIELSTDKTEAIIKGSDLQDFAQIHIYAVDENQDAWLLAEVPVDSLADGTAIHNQKLTFPEALPSGEYTIKAVGLLKDENGTEVANPIVETDLRYVNPQQPEVPTKVEVALGGDYTVDVTPTVSGNYDGYFVTIYEQKSASEKDVTIFKDLMLSKTKEVLTVGGQYVVPVMDENGNPTEETRVVGLEAGKKYVIGVRSYKTLADGNVLLSEEKLSSAILMVEAEDVELKFAITGAVKIETEGATLDTIGAKNVTVKITGVDTVKNGSYTLNDGTSKVWTGGDISFTNLENGVYVLSIVGENANGDSFGAKYQFAVDVREPRLMISSPMDGFFRGEKVVITGISEVGSSVTAMIEQDTLGRTNTQQITSKAGDDGKFEVEVPMNQGLYQQTVKLYATDVVGNVSRTITLHLVNALAGSEDAQMVLLADGVEAKVIFANGENVQLEMALKVGDQIIRFNEDSMAAALVDYQLTIYEGSATVNTEGVFNGSANTIGMIRGTLDGYEVAVRIVGANLEDATVTLDIPEGGYVYDETAKKPPVKSVVLKGISLKEGEDYTVSYVNNIAAGTGVVLIEAVSGGRYLGIKTLEFTIEKATIQTIVPPIAEPEANTTPQTKLHIEGCEAAEMVWLYEGNEFDGKFELGEKYIATILLKADANHVFAENVTATGWIVTVNADKSLTLKREFTAVADSEQVETHLITFVANNKVIATRVVEDGATLTDIPEIPAKIGHMQTAPVWSVTNFSNIREDMTVHAIYTPDVYTVTFIADGEIIKTMKVGYMETVEGDAFPAIPEKVGYTDTKATWDKSAVRDITGDCTVTAVYTANQYSIEVPENIYGCTLTVPYDEIRYGEDFAFTITIKEGYIADKAIVILNGVKVDQKFLTAKENQIMVEIPAEDMVKFYSDKDREIDINVDGIISEDEEMENTGNMTGTYVILVLLGCVLILTRLMAKKKVA